MPDLSNNSFIPKRGPVQRRVSNAARPVYIFTIFSYLLMFSTLIASGGVFVYKNIVEKQYQEELMALRQDIADFKIGQMQEVMRFDLRLQQITGRVKHNVSLTKIYDALEAATIDTVKFNKLHMQRTGDDSIELAIESGTDTFDSIIFQRKTYIEENPITASLLLTDVTGPATVLQTEEEGDEQKITGTASYVANISVPLTDILFDPDRTSVRSDVLDTAEVTAVIDQANEDNL